MVWKTIWKRKHCETICS